MVSKKLPEDFVVAQTSGGNIIAVPYMWLDDWIGVGETRWTRWGHYVAFAHMLKVIDGHVPMLTPTEEPTSQPTPLVTASQVGRLMKCSGGARLPRVTDLAKERAAERGTEIHAEILDEDMQSTKGAFLWNWLHQSLGGPNDFSATETARIFYSFGQLNNLGRLDTHRAYAPEPGARWALGGTSDADAVSIDHEGVMTIRVADLKTGRLQLYGGALDAPGDAWQLRTLAVLRWLDAGLPERVRIYLAWACWDDEDQRGWIVEADRVFDYGDVSHWFAQLVEFMNNITARGDDYVRGPHCRLCSSFTFCPVQRTALAQIESVVPDLATVIPDDLEALTESQMSDLYWNTLALEEQAESARAALAGLIARRVSVPVGHGKEAVVKNNLIRRITKPSIVERLARKIGVSKWYRQEVSITTLREGIAAAHDEGVLAAEGKPADVLETFLQQLEQEGAIDYQPTEPFIHIRKAVSK